MNQMNQEQRFKIILSQVISEKATIATEKNNEYVFQVVKTATKAEIKDAVEFLFATKVKQVRTMNVKPKQKLFRGMPGTRKGWKKAYVTLLSDQKLDMMEHSHKE